MHGILSIPLVIVTTMLDWCRHVIIPLSVVREGFQRKYQNDTSALVRAYWLFPIVLTVASNGAVMHFYGIELLSEPVLTILYLTIVTFNVIVGAFILTGVLWIMRARTNLGIVFVCYSIFVVYSPLFSWTNVAATIHSYDVLTYLKAQHLDLADTASFFLSHAKEIHDRIAQPIPNLTVYLAAISAVISLVSATLVAECLVQALALQRVAAYTGTAIAGALSLIPAVVLELPQMAIMFSYIGGSVNQ